MDCLRNVFTYMKQNPRICFASGLSVSYLLYYLLVAVQHPKVYSSKQLRQFLHKHCSTLGKKFWPAFWCFETRAQTIVSALLKSSPPIPYVREVLITKDGGQVALDWVAGPVRGSDTEATQPTVVMLPGLTGSSDDSYVRHLARQVIKLGYRLVVFNNRGNGGLPLLTPRMYNACNPEDLTEVIAHVEQKYPDAPLLATGISLGGIILMNYLSHTKKECKLVGAMTICVPYEVLECSNNLEKPINYLVFNKRLTQNLLRNFDKNKHMFKEKVDVDKAMKSKCIRDFDEHVTSKMFGYKTHKEYYEDACVHQKLRDVTVPTLCLNAEDDPFSPAHALPKEEASASQNVALVVTRHGGHIGFVDTPITPWDENYMDRMFAQWIDAVFQHRNELSQNQ